MTNRPSRQTATSTVSRSLEEDAASLVFAGPGEMRALCREFDWSSTALGPVEGWSQSLRTAAGIVLASRNPMFLWWGHELIQIYNDAYRPSFGEGGRHPRALGASGREFWPDIWHAIGPEIEQVMSGGESTWHEDHHLPIERNGRLEDVWWTYSYSAVHDDDGSIGGTLVVCQETTQRVLAARERDRMLEDNARAERALRASEAQLRAIYDGTHEYIGLLSPDGILLEANRASLEFGGARREDVIGKLFWETMWFVHTPGAPAQVRESVARAAAGEFVRFEATLRRPSGEPMIFDISFDPVRNEHGQVVLIVPECRDITGRQRAESALRASEARYQSLFASLDQGFCVIEMIFDAEDHSIDYRFLEANPAFVQQTGLVDAVGRTARELVPDLEDHWFEIYGKVALTGKATRFKDVSEPMGRWFDVYAFPVGEPEEHHVALLFTDVSAAVEAEREREKLLSDLQVERARLADVFRQAPAFLAVLRGQEHVFELVNDAYYQLVGHRDLVGRRVVDALPEVRDQGFVELLDRVLVTGEPFVGREVPLLISRTPGESPEERFVDLVYLRLEDGDEARSGVIAHGTDVTEQVLARREVERLLRESEEAGAEARAARAEAEAANRAKSDFLAVMSHELRTPLNAIGGYAELLEMGIRGAVTAQQKEDLQRIQTSQRHLLGLINEVLNYAKLETGTLQYDLGSVSAREALAAAESLVMPQARAKGLTLVVEQHPSELIVKADPEKLRQILVNLLSNAVKFTDRGGRIDISCTAQDSNVVFRIRDTGIGIPEDKLGAIFDPFVQVRADLTRPHEGTGLGLAISRELARGMGGDLRAESEVGVGSTFTVELPRAQVQAGNGEVNSDE